MPQSFKTLQDILTFVNSYSKYFELEPNLVKTYFRVTFDKDVGFSVLVNSSGRVELVQKVVYPTP